MYIFIRMHLYSCIFATFMCVCMFVCVYVCLYVCAFFSFFVEKNFQSVGIQKEQNNHQNYQVTTIYLLVAVLIIFTDMLVHFGGEVECWGYSLGWRVRRHVQIPALNFLALGFWSCSPSSLSLCFPTIKYSRVVLNLLNCLFLLCIYSNVYWIPKPYLTLFEVLGVKKGMDTIGILELWNTLERW